MFYDLKINFPENAIVIDESPWSNLYTITNSEGDEQMFNPTEVLNNLFTVTFTKANGDLSSLTGRLVAPNYDGDDAALLAYCVELLDAALVPVWVDGKGWRSFYVNKVISFKLENANA